MKKLIKIVLWDFGGVLTRSPIQNFYKYEKENKLPLGTIIKINSQNKYKNAWAKLEKNIISIKEFSLLFSKEAKELNIDHCFDIGKIINCLDVSLNVKMVNIFFEVKKKVECACLTNNILATKNYNINKTFNDFKKNFSYVFESSKLGIRKPEIEIYKYVIDKLNVAPENILFIDDLGINLKPAKDLGIHTYKAANEDKVEEFLDRFLF